MNITWFVWKIHDHPISRGKYLPGYIVENRGIIPLDRKIQRGKPYEEKEKVQELTNTDKLNWESAHEPLSVSVCSSVPDYEELKCFVSDGDSNLLLEEFVQYLTTPAPKVHPCYANSTQKSLKRLSGNLFLVVASQKMINSHKSSYTSRKQM